MFSFPVWPVVQIWPVVQSCLVQAVGGNAAASKYASSSGYPSVMTCEQRRHAAMPCSFHHLQRGLILQCGKRSVAGVKCWTVLAASVHRPCWKWAQLASAHGAANRNTSAGRTGCVSARIAGSTGMGSASGRMRAALVLASTTPVTTLPSQSG